MAEFVRNLFGNQQAPIRAAPVAPDSDFADFAGAPEPSPVSFLSSAVSATLSATSTTTGLNAPPTTARIVDDRPRPFTKWYRVWERTYPSDFYTEMFIVPFLLVLVLVHLWGTRRNKDKARAWMTAHGPILQQEFASVGFSARKTNVDAEILSRDALHKNVFREKSASEYITYATGRQNVAFADIKVTLAKRYNPMARVAEEGLGYIFESMPAPRERMEAVIYTFDGRENDLIITQPTAGDQKREKFNSSYDGFVWAVVHKDAMQYWRNARYDLSLTTTRDHAKLPQWATIMTESAEITDTLLKDDLIKAINDAGDLLEALVISDQPVDKPLKLDEATPKKRISLITRLPSGTDPSSYSTTIPIFTQFLRLADTLANIAHFRPEVTRKIRQTREDEIKKIKKLDEGEKADERRTKLEKEKKKERDEKLRILNPEEQKKFLEKERAMEMRRGQKKRSMKA